jgi:hypothetical protein
MFIRFCFGSWGCGSECGRLREIRAAYRAFLSPSRGTKDPSMSVIEMLRQQCRLSDERRTIRIVDGLS